MKSGLRVANADTSAPRISGYVERSAGGEVGRAKTKMWATVDWRRDLCRSSCKEVLAMHLCPEELVVFGQAMNVCAEPE